MNSSITGFTGATVKGIVYSPTWPTYNPNEKNLPQQFSDSDFFNDAFQGFWNTGNDGNGNNYRNDIATMGSANFNLIRLYNWGPTRGWGAPANAWPSQWQIPTTPPTPAPAFERGNGHINALDYAQTNGMQVIVPISNYFLSNDIYAWNGNDPDSNFSFTSAPLSLQQDLIYFLSSVCYTNTAGNVVMHPAVASFSVGNEIDINNMAGQGGNGASAVGPTSRLKRVMWWFVNLAAQMGALNIGPVGLTSPISNADQSAAATSPFSYWFGAFVNGVSDSTALPFGTALGTDTTETTFSASVSGVSSISAVSALYYNSVNIYQYGAGLTATLGQYDSWQTNSANNFNWPGQQFTCPLLLTEIGWSRPDDSTTSQNTQYNLYTTEIVSAIQTYLSGNTSSHLAGYCIYEFNDEAWLGQNQNGFGIFMQPSTNENLNTGPTAVSYTTFPTTQYPVYTLQSVAYTPPPTPPAQSTTLISELTTLQA